MVKFYDQKGRQRVGKKGEEAEVEAEERGPHFNAGRILIDTLVNEKDSMAQDDPTDAYNSA